MRPVIVFTDEEVAYMHWLAEERRCPKRAAGVYDRRVDEDMDPQDMDYVGVVGEAAVGRWLGVPFNQFSGLHGDGGEYDIKFHELKLQVKGTRYLAGRLLFTTLDKFTAHAGVLVTLNNDSTANIAGVISRAKFMSNYTYSELKKGCGPQYHIGQEYLSPIERLLRFGPRGHVGNREDMVHK